MRADQAYIWLKEALTQAGMTPEEAHSEARLLLAAALDVPLSHLPLHRRETVEEAWLLPRLQRRRQGEPLQYILGETEFMGLTLRALPQALIPRGDSEVVVERAVALARQLADRQHLPPLAGDICTGSGAFAVALACFLPDFTVYAVDISPGALTVARENCQLNHTEDRVRLLEGDLLLPLQAQGLRLSLLIANPPYIPSQEIAALDRELQYEPWAALDGGPDGLSFYRRLAVQAGQVLYPGGRLILEHGAGQRAGVCAILREAGWTVWETGDDYGGRDRFVVAGLAGD
ncbi:MAG: peptide chain release factor N(5)-glutamine methyltransferase [Firmicutes bacterium]|nr:peptide chain release factor N(5)-glutamine methyltransferase [Bacillota bacterium]